MVSALLAGAALACSSAATTTGGGSEAPLLSGTYEAIEAGPISTITFYMGNHYILVDSNCQTEDSEAEDGGETSSGSSCSEAGVFAIDSAGDTLTFSPTDGVVHALPFSSVVPGTVVEEDEALHTLGLTTGAGTSLASPGSGSGGLASSLGGSLACSPTQSQATPAGGFKAGPQSFKSSSSQGDPSSGWSCGGSFNRTKSSSGTYYITSFGCAGGLGDNGDNCCAAGAVNAYNAGLCPKTKAAGVTPSSNCSNSCASSNSVTAGGRRSRTPRTGRTTAARSSSSTIRRARQPGGRTARCSASRCRTGRSRSSWTPTTRGRAA